jgi:hypothetical protein
MGRETVKASEQSFEEALRLSPTIQQFLQACSEALPEKGLSSRFVFATDRVFITDILLVDVHRWVDINTYTPRLSVLARAWDSTVPEWGVFCTGSTTAGLVVKKILGNPPREAKVVVGMSHSALMKSLKM